MRRINLAVMLLLVLAMMWGCANLAPTEPAPASEATATITASPGSLAGILSAAEIDSFRIKVYGSKIDTIRKTTAFAGAGTKISIQVPAGKALILDVSAVKGETVVMRGSSSFTAAKNKTTRISLKLDFLLASLVLTPPDSSYGLAGTFDLYVAARKVNHLATIGAQVKFDTSALEVVDISRLDDFLESSAGTVLPLKFSRDNIKGEVNLQLAVFPATAAVSGSGDICKITFQPKKTGESKIDLYLDNSANRNWGLFDENAVLISSLGLGSTVRIN